MVTEKHFLDSFFHPSSVAVVGVSKNPHKMTHNLFANLVSMNFKGRLYPVNPGADEICGLKAHSKLQDIDDELDLVVCGVPAHQMLGVIKDCVEHKRVKGVIMVAGGFSEIGDEGLKVQKEIKSLLSENGIRAIGPNSLSPINSSNSLIIDFGPHKELKPGQSSFIFQSGLYAPRLHWLFSEYNLGVNKLIDLGNKMDINEVDALEYLVQDESTKVIGIHMESMAGDPKRFFQLLRENSRKKPIVVLKSGRTEAGGVAASSHTGAIAKGSDNIFDTALKQAGVIRARTVEDLFDYVKAFELMMPLKINDNRIALCSYSGGEGVITTDLCEDKGFRLAEVSDETYDKIQNVSPPWSIAPNPFDLGVCGQFHHPIEVYKVFLESLINDDNVDCFLCQIGMGGMPLDDDFLNLFLKARENGKPLVIWPMDDLNGNAESVKWLESKQVPVYPTSERALKALSALNKYSTYHR